MKYGVHSQQLRVTGGEGGCSETPGNTGKNCVLHC